MPFHTPSTRCVGGAGLSVVCRLISEDCSGWRGGMPDLLLWRPDRGDAMVSEVKVGRGGQEGALIAAQAGRTVQGGGSNRPLSVHVRLHHLIPWASYTHGHQATRFLACSAGPSRQAE